MEKLETTCIRCPMGCHLVVTNQNEEIIVKGNTCPRGAEYGKQEFTCPMRTITAVYRLSKGGTLAVRTNKAVKKSLYFDILKAIKNAREPATPDFGDILIKNVCGTSADVIITAINKNNL